MSGATTISRRRERELAGDKRSWPRAEARRLQHEYLRRHWKYPLVIALFVLALAPLLWLLPEWLRGPAAGALLATAVWTVVLQAVVGTDTARKMSGGEAEAWTATELRRLRRRGWHVVNHVLLRRYSEIDHVLVGPGGLIAFETKRIGEPASGRDVLDARVAEAVEQIKEGSHWLYKMFPNDVPRDACFTVVVLWGPEGSAWGPPRDVDGTTVLSGRYLSKWLRHLRDDRLSTATIARVWTELDRQLEMRDRYEQQQRDLQRG